MSQNNQPTIEELRRAWTDAIYGKDIPGYRTESHQILLDLRNKKHTWVGKEENDLRFALDNYLRGDK